VTVQLPVAPASKVLPERWSILRPHNLQRGYWTSNHRFNLLPCGRRSGKTELFKRKIVKRAMKGTQFDNARFFASAPTLTQAIQIYWQDLKALTPKWAIADISESNHIIKYLNGSEVHVLGMDKPERVEGQPWDGGGLDEYGNMKERAWSAHVRPALSDRLGWCDFLGVPEGRNHYFELYEKAKEDMASFGEASPWWVYEWESKDILPPEEIEAARRDLHPLMFEQEYGGKFVDFTGVSIFDISKWLDNGNAVPMPNLLDGVIAIIDTAVKTGKDNDGTGVIYGGVWGRGDQRKVYVLDWDYQQIRGDLLPAWLPTVFQRLEALAKECHARAGSLGAMIEDKSSGMVLLQHATNKGWNARPLPADMTALGKDERALSVSGYHYGGKVKIVGPAWDKVLSYKGQVKNHLRKQVEDFRLGDPDAAKRADDLLDTYTYLLAVTMGDSRGF
jgi:hypothetical protein